MRRSSLRRLPAAVLPLLLLGTPASAAEEPPPPNMQEVDRLYVEGQTRHESDDFLGAADSWERVLHLLPEEEKHRDIRAAVVINIMQVLLDAYDRLPAEDGMKVVAHLERAMSIGDAYLSTLRDAYGADVHPGAAVMQKRAEIEIAIKRDHEQEYFEPDVGPCLEQLPPPRGCGRGPTKMAFVMLATLGLGIRRRRDALDKVESVLPSDVVARLRSRLDRDD